MRNLLKGDFIDLKIVAAAALLLLIAGIGVAYAAQWNPMFIGRFRGNATNMTVRGWRFNATNGTNYTAEYQQFVQAIQDNDYTTAQQLHQQYGFGGKLFDKLNATTFSQVSQIYTLSTELRQELGMKGQPGAFLYDRGFARGFIMGRHMGVGHGCANAINSTTS